MSEMLQLSDLARIAEKYGANAILQQITEDEVMAAASQISRATSTPVVEAVEKAALQGHSCTREEIAIAMTIHRARALLSTTRALRQTLDATLAPLNAEAAAEIRRALFAPDVNTDN